MKEIKSPFYNPNKKFNPKIYCKFCGISFNIKNMTIAYEIHYECWKYYRESGQLYPKMKYY